MTQENLIPEPKPSCRSWGVTCGKENERSGKAVGSVSYEGVTIIEVDTLCIFLCRGWRGDGISENKASIEHYI